MGSARNGDIVLVQFPFTDISSTKIRPAIIISRDIIHKVYDDCTLMFISSVIPIKIEPFEYVFRGTHPDFSRSGLKVDSVVKGNKIVTLNMKLILRKLGTLGKMVKNDINRIIGEAIFLE